MLLETQLLWYFLRYITFIYKPLLNLFRNCVDIVCVVSAMEINGNKPFFVFFSFLILILDF